VAPPPTTGLVSYWTFDGNINDVAGAFAENVGTAADNLTPGDGSANFEPGQIGQALRVGVNPGDTTHLSAPVSADVQLPPVYTIEAWVKPSELADSWQRLVLNWGGAEQAYHFAIRNNSGFANAVSLFHEEVGGGQPNANGGTLLLDAWHHIAGVADGTNLIVYLNGEPVGSMPYDGTINVCATEGLGIGDSAGALSTIRYNGLLDDLAIWLVPLTEEQIRFQYQQGLLGHGALTRPGPEPIIPEPATFALADLHCWLDYLVENELAVLEFQARCRNLFLSCDPLYAGTYSPHRDVGRFPAGRAVYTAIDNYLEVEHQAEWLFRVPRDFLTVRLDGAFTVKRDGVSEVPAAVWMPPHLRGIFVRLREHLSAANQEVWDEAAASRFDRSYLANMLFRVSHAGALDQLAVVLERFSAAHAKADRHKLMDVVFYRGGDPSGGVEWGDRFAARLMDAAGVMAGTDEQALLRSQHFTRATLGTWKNYGWSGTLREVLSDGKLDCINAADMIGALFRNAGHAGYYNIRWCAGLAGHTVAAAEVATAGGSAVVIVDGLQPPQTSAESWPYAYTRGTAWPEGYTGRQADVHAVELYSRGLDNYVWVEGYIVRGPNAGILVRASVPYLPNRLRSSTLRVDRGSRPDAAPSGAG